MASLEISRRCGSGYSEGIALHAVGRNHLMAGQIEYAIEYLEAALALIEQYGYDAPKPHVAGLLASALARGNRADEALKLTEECFDKDLHLRTGRMELFYLYSGYAEALFRSGAVERSLPAVDQALEIARSINNPCLTSQGLALRAQFTSIINPDSPLLVRDRQEHLALCEKHGLKVLL